MEPQYAHMVVDTNAIIAGASSALRGMAARYWTVSSVFDELRDAQSRAAVSMLPFKLETRVPSEAALEAVKAFAAKTGDLRTLSRPDLQLLALTYQVRGCGHS